MGQYYWPPGVPRSYTFDSYRQAFEAMGFSLCATEAYEEGFDKVALWVNGGRPTHAALHLEERFWTSKLGALQDIKHDLHGVSGSEYGDVAGVMRRQAVSSC